MRPGLCRGGGRGAVAETLAYQPLMHQNMKFIHNPFALRPCRRAVLSTDRRFTTNVFLGHHTNLDVTPWGPKLWLRGIRALYSFFPSHGSYTAILMAWPSRSARTLNRTDHVLKNGQLTYLPHAAVRH